MNQTTLSPALPIHHLLACLAEEGGEVAKECMKSIRFGLDDQLTMNPDGARGTSGPTNREKIRDEFIDLLGVYQMLVVRGELPSLGLDDLHPEVLKKMAEKAMKVRRFMGYSVRVGALASEDSEAPV